MNMSDRLKEVEPKKAEKSSKAIPVMANVIPAKSSRETVKDSNINAAVVSPPDSVVSDFISCHICACRCMHRDVTVL